MDRELKKSGESMPSQQMQGGRKRKWVVLAAAVLILAGGVGGYYFHDYAGLLTRQNRPYAFSQQGGTELPAVRNTAVVQAVEKVGPAVVGITTRVYDKDLFNRRVEVGKSVGSGVIFDKKGYIVTNNHVVAGSKEVNVSLSNGSTVQGKVVGTDPSTDLAVVKIKGSDDLPVAEFGDSDHLKVGETAIAIGNPLGLEFQGTVTVGVISALNRTLDQMEQHFKLIQTDAAINPGNSGGALVTADGKVVGINSAKIAKEGVEGMGFAIPINQAKGIIESLIRDGHVTRAYIGIYAADKDIAARYGYSWDNAKGILVMKVAPDGPLSGTAVHAGDYIISIDGQETNTVSDLLHIVDAHKPGDRINLTYLHNGTEQQASLVLGQMNQEQDE